MVSSHHQIISHFHAEKHRSLNKKTASSSFRSSWEMLMQQAGTQQHSWALESQVKVQASLCPITKQPWASTVAPRSPNFLTCRMEIISPKHTIITGTKCLLWNLAHSRHSNLGASQSHVPSSTACSRVQQATDTSMCYKLLPASILHVIYLKRKLVTTTKEKVHQQNRISPRLRQQHRGLSVPWFLCAAIARRCHCVNGHTESEM